MSTLFVKFKIQFWLGILTIWKYMIVQLYCSFGIYSKLNVSCSILVFVYYPIRDDIQLIPHEFKPNDKKKYVRRSGWKEQTNLQIKVCRPEPKIKKTVGSSVYVYKTNLNYANKKANCFCGACYNPGTEVVTGQ